MGVEENRGQISGVEIEGDYGSQTLKGDCFVDTTGSAGPPARCHRYGSGCVMCILRCPTFGGRLSLTELAGLEVDGDDEGIAMSGSCKLIMDTLDGKITSKLKNKGIYRDLLPARAR